MDAAHQPANLGRKRPSKVRGTPGWERKRGVAQLHVRTAWILMVAQCSAIPRQVRHYDATTFWTGGNQEGSITSGNWWDNDYKCHCIFHLGAKEVMMYAHQNGAYRGHAVYDVKQDKIGDTLHSMLATGTNHQWTNDAKATGGSVGNNGRARNQGEGFARRSFAEHLIGCRLQRKRRVAQLRPGFSLSLRVL